MLVDMDVVSILVRKATKGFNIYGIPKNYSARTGSGTCPIFGLPTGPIQAFLKCET